jgi:hypothetical protein
VSQLNSPRAGSLFELEYPQSVGIYQTYDEAQKVVDFLADSKFPVQNLAIVGTELRSVERVLGRRTWGTVLLGGVQNGITTGVIMALIFWVFSPGLDNVWVLFLYALAIGVIVGVVFGALGYWMAQGKRDFTSVSQTVATKYEILAEHKVAVQARDLVRTMPGAAMLMFTPAAAPPGGFGAPSYPMPGYPAPAAPAPAPEKPRPDDDRPQPPQP